MWARIGSRHLQKALVGTSAGVFCAAVAHHSSNTVLHTESAPEPALTTSSSSSKRDKKRPDAAIIIDKQQQPPEDQSRSTFTWGGNQQGVANPQDPADQLKKPKALAILDGLVLRDLALHEQYAVAVDGKGDLLQWGADRPALQTTLRGRNIVKVALTPHKIYALSSNGKVFVLSAQAHVHPPSTLAWLTSYLWSSPSGAEHLELKPDAALGLREKFQDLQAGTSHVLALTSSGRCFAAPVDLRANDMGQLGVRHVHFAGLGDTPLYPTGFNPNEYATADTRSMTMELAQAKALPRSWLPDRLKVQLEQTEEADKLAQAAEETARKARDQYTQAERHPAFCPTLYEIPSLKEVKVAQIAVGDRHNLVRTPNGRVLAFGANACGQLGIGGQYTLPVIPTPTEVALSKHAPKTGSLVCTHIAAGGSDSYFVAERSEPSRPTITELYAAGNGQFGAIGNGQWMHQTAPAKVKTLSGLLEWDEKRNSLATIAVHALSAGRNHVAATLSNSSMDQSAAYGRDVYIWGQNTDSQLGNGKRAHAPVPQTLPALPRNEEVLAAKRLQLAPLLKYKGYKVEETITCGYNSTAVYWKVAR